jgi:hypothetical protein
VKKPTAKSPILVTATLALGLALWTTVAATAGENGSFSSCSPALWPEVKKLAESCLALREDGELRENGDCDGIALEKDARSASFNLGDVRFEAEISDSENSDGGDLNDVLIRGDDGCELELRDVFAAGDLLAALASVH